MFCNVFRSYPFSKNISVRYPIPALKYFPKQILVALASNPLNLLAIVPDGIQKCGLICTFLRVGL